MQTGVLALLLLCGFISCKKDVSSTEDLTQAKARPNTISTQVDEVVLQTGCPDCVANYTPQTETAATNGVIKLEGTSLTAAGTTITTISSTKETYTVGNVIVTVSHDDKNVYFTLERNNSTGKFGNIRFYSPAVVPVPSTGNGNKFGFPTEVKKIQVIRSRESLSACSEINFSFSVKGGGNSTDAGDVETSSALTYVLRDLCPVCTIQVGDYRTQTRGYWTNKNGQTFLSEHLGLFPVMIGDGNNTEDFPDAASVGAYLDTKASANGTPGVLPNGGTFAAQVLTLAVNLKADNQIAHFSKVEGKLANLVVNISEADIAAHPTWSSLAAWNGKTVQQIFDIAQKVLGGTSTEYTPSLMNQLVTAINESFDNGIVDTGFLGCGK